MQKKQPHPLKAVIFDMDGTLIDTETIGAASWDHAGADMGIKVPPKVKQDMIGRTLPDIHTLVDNAMPEVNTDKLLERANFHYHRLISERPPPMKPGARELLEALHARGIPMALATSSRSHQAEDKLARTGLRPFFSVLIAGDQVARGKPDPEIFLTAAELLGLHARDCAILEDSGPGIEAAERSGALAILVPEAWPPDPLHTVFAHHALPDLHAALALLNTLF